MTMGQQRDNGRRHDTNMNHRELVLAAKHDRGRREDLIEAFSPLVAGLARGYVRWGVIDRRELMQQGVVGLLRALERYDPSLGTPFWAYATWWVRQAMQQLVSELAGPVVLSDRAQRELARLTASRRTYVQDHSTEPTRAQLAVAAEMDQDRVDCLMAAGARPRPLEEPIGDADDGDRLGDRLADHRAEDEFECVNRRTTVESLPTLLAQLDERERFVVSGRFGLDREACTLREIGDDLGVSAERVRQIEQRALEALRAMLTGPPSDFALVPE
jgi:RNA polymerase sigma factor (sigma-70 family)